MKRLYSYVGPSKSPLQEAPEVIDALSVHLTANIFLYMIHGGVNVILCGQMIVGRIAVSVNGIFCAFDPTTVSSTSTGPLSFPPILSIEPFAMASRIRWSMNQAVF